MKILVEKKETAGKNKGWGLFLLPVSHFCISELEETLSATTLQVLHVNYVLFLHNIHQHFSFSSVFVKCQIPARLQALGGSGCVLVLIVDPEANTMFGLYKMLIRYILSK